MIIHPDFEYVEMNGFQTPSHDICLVKVSPMTLDYIHIGPVCLPSADDHVGPNIEREEITSCVVEPESCLFITTTENQGRMYIELQFTNQPAHNFGEVYIADDESWSQCFPSEDLVSFSLRNEDGNSWVGTVSMTHTDQKYEALMLCTENCDCECGDRSEEDYQANGCDTCVQHSNFELGIDNDSNVDGDTKCRFGNTCPFAVSWVITGTF